MITMAISRLLVVCLTFAIAILLQPHGGGKIWAQELFGFPVDEVINPKLENARNRTPVFIPGKCSENEILYPGDHDSDWVCDCRPGYVYAPLQDSCYPLYQQGFCKPGEYVDLARPSLIVQCTVNKCTGKNEVPYKNKCVKLYQNNGSCQIVNRVSWVIGVNTTTMELDCIKGATDFLEVIVANRNMDDSDEQPSMKMKNVTAKYFEGANRCNIGTKSRYEHQCP